MLFFKEHNTRMKTTKRLNIEDKPGYFFMNMTNIIDFDPKLLVINEFTIFENKSTIFEINYCQENNPLNIVYNNLECIFRKTDVFSYLIFCEAEKNKKMLGKYTKIIDEIKQNTAYC